MRCLKVRTYKEAREKPYSVITIPLALAKLARQLIPRAAREDLERKGLDLAAILDTLRKEKISGPVVEIEKDRERIVISVE